MSKIVDIRTVRTNVKSTAGGGEENQAFLCKPTRWPGAYQKSGLVRTRCHPR